MRSLRHLLAGPALLAAVSDPGPGLWDETRSAADAFRSEVLEGRDLEAAARLLAPDVVFRDPTAAGFDAAIGAGVRGRDAVLRSMRGFGLTRARLEVESGFHAGPFAVRFGALTTEGASTLHAAPFLTVLRVEDGRIAARTDYGDYDELLTPAVRIDGVEGQRDHPLVALALEYMHGLAEHDLGFLGQLLHERASYDDPTAIALGQSARRLGREAVLERLRSADGPRGFHVDELARFFSQGHAVFAGHFETTAALHPEDEVRADETTRISLPFVTVLRIEGDAIVEHIDYVGYDAVHAARRAHADQERLEEGL